MKTTILFLIFSGLFCTAISAQKESSVKNVKFKIYLNGLSNKWEDSQNWSIEDQTVISKNKTFEFGNISLGLEFDNGKHISHEFEVLPFIYQHSNIDNSVTGNQNHESIMFSGEESRNMKMNLRYQLNYYFLINKIFKPYIGGSAQLYYESNRNIPQVSMSFPSKNNKTGCNFSIVPGLDINLNEHLFLDFNVPFIFGQINTNNIITDNPGIPEGERNTTTLEGIFLPNIFQFRVGIGYNFH